MALLVSNASFPRKGLCKNKIADMQPLSPLLQSLHPPSSPTFPFATPAMSPVYRPLSPASHQGHTTS